MIEGSEIDPTVVSCDWSECSTRNALLGNALRRLINAVGAFTYAHGNVFILCINGCLAFYIAPLQLLHYSTLIYSIVGEKG